MLRCNVADVGITSDGEELDLTLPMVDMSYDFHDID